MPTPNQLHVIEMRSGNGSTVLDKVVAHVERGTAIQFNSVLRKVIHPIVLNNDIASCTNQSTTVCYLQ